MVAKKVSSSLGLLFQWTFLCVAADTQLQSVDNEFVTHQRIFRNTLETISTLVDYYENNFIPFHQIAHQKWETEWDSSQPDANGAIVVPIPLEAGLVRMEFTISQVSDKSVLLASKVIHFTMDLIGILRLYIHDSHLDTPVLSFSLYNISSSQ